LLKKGTQIIYHQGIKCPDERSNLMWRTLTFLGMSFMIR